MNQGQPRNTVQCPVCGAWAEFPVVDIGVGEQQCGPAGCESCGWCEPMPKFPEIDHDPFSCDHCERADCICCPTCGGTGDDHSQPIAAAGRCGACQGTGRRKEAPPV